ncbi:MAG: transposase, partial [bacterium]|nr:transposase [bacterium]
MMTRHRLEVADVVRSHVDGYLDSRGGRVPGPERRVLSAISTCRTAACGGHIDRCDRCDHQQIAYNSCRNRHCPKCQATARRRWLSDRQRDLLPVEYFHVVFTIPHLLASLALQNRKAVYAILFKTSAEAMRELARDPKYLGAEIGFVSVLHTWGETLMLHPHVHCVVPGGGIAPDDSRWVPCR